MAEREAIIAHLQRLAACEAAHYEQQRRRRLAAQLDALHEERQKTVLVSAPTAIVNQGFANLLEGVSVTPDRIAITFGSATEALQRLLALAMAIRNDELLFERLVTGSKWKVPIRPDLSKWSESRLASEIQKLLGALEAKHSSGVALPAEEVVARAVMLIRLYSEGLDSGAAWLDREHARRTANLLKTQRLLGSRAIERPKGRLFPTASELLREQEELGAAEPLEITLFDLVQRFGGLLEKVKKYESRRTAQLQDPP